jgi:hypothetical protein
MKGDNMENEREDLNDILGYDVNKAKDILEKVYWRLKDAGYERKANSCWTLITKIEAWQNRR